MGRYDNLIEKIKTIDTDSVKEWASTNNPVTNLVEKQRIYIWIRLYLKEECQDLQIGDDFKITYTPSGEYLDCKFICFDKTSLTKEHDSLEKVANFNPEDDKKVLCLMLDEDDLKNDSVSFIRTLFKNTRYYQEQVYKRSELTFVNKRNGINLEYFDCAF